MKESAEVLRILSHPKVDLETAACRSTASVALWTYCRAATALGRTPELLEILERWRPTYLLWIEEPTIPVEARYLQWFEEILQSNRTGRPLG